MADVFISYKREDRAHAVRLDAALRAAGYSVWWDTSLVAGEHFNEAIDRELNAAGCVVVIWSEAAVKSRWVNAEATHAFGRDQLVAARLDDVALKYPFSVVQTCDLRQPGGEGAVIAGVAAKVGAREVVVDPPPEPEPPPEDPPPAEPPSPAPDPYFETEVDAPVAPMPEEASPTTSVPVGRTDIDRVIRRDLTFAVLGLAVLVGTGLMFPYGGGLFAPDRRQTEADLPAAAAVEAPAPTQEDISSWASLNPQPATDAMEAIGATDTSAPQNVGAENVWTAAVRPVTKLVLNQASAVIDANWSPDGARIVTGSGDHTARVWDARSGQSLLILQGHTSGVTSAAFSPDGARIVTGSRDNTARIWDAQSGQSIRTLQGHTGWVDSAAFSPDGARIVTASNDGTARVWDARSGQSLLTMQGHADVVTSAAYSPDGARIVTGSYDKTARVWDASSGQFLLTLQGHAGNVLSATFSEDSARIVTASSDKTSQVWNARSGQSLFIYHGHTELVESAAFSPDSTRVVTAGQDYTARVWDARSGQSHLTLHGHSGYVRSVAFSPDGARIVTGSNDGTARVWAPE